MQKIKVPVLICGIIVVLLIIIFCIFIFGNKNVDRTIAIYNNIVNSQRFQFTREEINQEIDYKISIAQRSTDVCIDMYSGEEHTSTLVLDGYAYYIMHNEQEYYSYGNDMIDADILISGFKELSESEYKTGEENINGVKYYYEEYTGNSTFIIFLDPTEDSQIYTRFYFDDDELVYIKNIVKNPDEEEQIELLKVTLEYDAPDSLFEIPTEYAEN